MLKFLSWKGSGADAGELPIQSFKDFVFGSKRHRIILWVSAALIVIQFGVFKYFYPYASFIHGDSFSYINAADKNLSINTYMVGYSNFIRLFSVFFKSDTPLVAFQYILIQFSSLFFVFTLFYFHKPNKYIQYSILLFITINPLLLHLANLISSDCYFISLSFLWISNLIWIIHRPTKTLLLLHCLILIVTFTVRYNALIYPLISLTAFILSSQSIKTKLVWFTGSIVLVFAFISYTSYQYKALTGYWQYSPFSGWQLTNNAMYAYRYVDSANRKPVPPKYITLDNMIRVYFDSTKRNIRRNPQEMLLASTVYMWDPRLTLYKYRNNLFKHDSSASELKKWASMGPLYKEYGIYIIKQYPKQYLQYFIIPNMVKYYVPPTEFLSVYNSGKDSVTTSAKNWFGYNSTKIKSRFKTDTIIVLKGYPILSGIVNVLMLLSLLCLLLLKGWKIDPIFFKTILLCGSMWLLNAVFTILASSAALRFQSFPFLLTTILSILQFSWLWEIAYKKNARNSFNTANLSADILITG